MGGKGSNRLNSSRIKRLPAVDDLSKTEAEMPEYMRLQKFTPEKIAELQKKLADWKAKHK
jgi:hypothetical protein